MNVLMLDIHKMDEEYLMKLERYSRDLEVQADVLGRVCKDLQMGLHRLDMR